MTCFQDLSQVLDPGYLWLDWFSVPVASLSRHLAHQHLLAAESMTAYVQTCDLFVALTPSVEHRETGKILGQE